MSLKRLERKELLVNLKKNLVIAGISFMNLSLPCDSAEAITSSSDTTTLVNGAAVKNTTKEMLNFTTVEIEIKEYYDCLCPHGLQDYIFRKCVEYDVPSDIVMTIIERESGGNWNTNGIISKTDDYGLAQINICNLELIEEVLGYTRDQILNNPYKNVEAAIYLLTIIVEKSTVDDNIDYENVFGMYNGWVNWKEIPFSVEYANGCMEILESKYSETKKVYLKKYV